MLVIVDTAKIKQNITKARLLAGKSKISGVVKTNAYGHGLGLIDRIESELDSLSVCSIAEALSLDTTKPIHVLGSILSHYDGHLLPNIMLAIERGITLTISDPESYKAIILAASYTTRPASVELKANTGMNRLGLTLRQLKDIVPALMGNPKVRLTGIFSHLADGIDTTFCELQLARFLQAVSLVPNGLHRHICATNFVGLSPSFRLDGIRLGIGMYGYGCDEFCPAMTAMGHVVQINTLYKGDRIGYGRTIAPHTTRSATIDFGYGDGVPRALSKGVGKLQIGGSFYPIIGTVCMDMTMVNIGSAPINVGDKAYYLSPGQTCQALANLTDSIPYEIMTSLSLKANYRYI